MTLKPVTINELSPLIQAPMAAAQDEKLAIAVCKSGGLGSLGSATLNLEELERQIKAVKMATDQAFNVNFFCHQVSAWEVEQQNSWYKLINQELKQYQVNPKNLSTQATRYPVSKEHIELVCDLKPAIISFHFGLPPEKIIKQLKSYGALILSTATTVQEAKWLEAHGVDAIIAQGIEAGGHRGNFLSEEMSTQLGLFALLPQLTRAVKCPLIAAGGINDEKTIRAAFALGASKVQIGTAFLLSHESIISKRHQKAINSEQSEHTALTNLYTGRYARSIVTPFMERYGMAHLDAAQFPYASNAVNQLNQRAKDNNDFQFASLWCGQNVNRRAVVSAAELTKEFLDIIQTIQ